MVVASITELASVARNRSADVVGVDGKLGVGKTTVSMGLAARTGWTCIHLDDYLQRHKGSFVDNLDLPALKAATRARPLIVEGLCLLKVFDRIAIHANCLVYVTGIGARRTEVDWRVFDEADEYLLTYRPDQTADVIFNMDKYQGNSSSDIDIAYIKAKTTISVVLALGGVLSILVGAMVFVLGLQGGDTALIKMAGVEMSAKGIGGVVLGTSAIWAYLAYLATPKYSRKRELRETKKSDGSMERHEFESSTQWELRPGSGD